MERLTREYLDKQLTSIVGKEIVSKFNNDLNRLVQEDLRASGKTFNYEQYYETLDLRRYELMINMLKKWY